MAAEHNALTRALSLSVHELRTPVTVVAGYLRMLLKEQGGPLTDKQRKMLEEADRSCGRIAALVAEMSELGKLESGDLVVAHQPFDLAALVEEVASGMHEGRDRGVRLEVRGHDRPLEITGDRPRLGAVIRALLHAALRERGTPGVVVARYGQLPDAQPPAALLMIGDDATVGTFADPAQTMPAFSEWGTDRKSGGLGLAMPVAQRVVAAHGGTLWSAPGDRPYASSALRVPLKV